MFYFGCWNGLRGHYLHKARGFEVSIERTPWGRSIDGMLAPAGPRVQGLATLAHKGGWTALAFWDNTVDQRPGSNSAFLVEGIKTFDEMVAMAKETFPEVWGRFPFKIQPA